MKISRSALTSRCLHRSVVLLSLSLGALAPLPARAIDFGGLANKAVGSGANAARDKAVKEVNTRLLAEDRQGRVDPGIASHRTRAGLCARGNR